MRLALTVGDAAEVTRTFAERDLAAFATLCGGGAADRVPEPLIAALFSYLLGVKLPGPGTNYLKQEMRFLAPARPGEALTARVEVTRIREEKALVDLRATCRDSAGTLVCEGRSLVLARDAGA